MKVKVEQKKRINKKARKKRIMELTARFGLPSHKNFFFPQLEELLLMVNDSILIQQDIRVFRESQVSLNVNQEKTKTHINKGEQKLFLDLMNDESDLSWLHYKNSVIKFPFISKITLRCNDKEYTFKYDTQVLYEFMISMGLLKKRWKEEAVPFFNSKTHKFYHIASELQSVLLMYFKGKIIENQRQTFVLIYDLLSIYYPSIFRQADPNEPKLDEDSKKAATIRKILKPPPSNKSRRKSKPKQI